METLLNVKNLSVGYYGDTGRDVAVDNVSFSVARGEILCIVGESGCGKSTLAMAIPRLLPEPPAFIDAESIKLCGEELLSLPRNGFCKIRGSRIGVIFQEPMTALSPLHRIGDQLEEAVSLHRQMGKVELRRLVLDWLERVGIPDPSRALLSYPHELSGGMQQRVMIAMALINDPDLVIADEPTTALDVTTQSQVLELVRKLVGKKSGLLLITHDMGVVRSMATRVAVMYAGRIIETASCNDLFSSPSHPYTRALLSSMPTLATRGRPLPVIEGFVPTLAECASLKGCRFSPRCKYGKECNADDTVIAFEGAEGARTSRCRFAYEKSLEARK